MAFDDKTRRTLFKTVTTCRNLLTEDFDEQLRGRYGIYADEGRVLEIDRLPSLTDTERETARLLRERIDHLAAGKGKQGISDAVHRIRREQAFTVLNRFAALRMAEERGVIRPSVGSGFNSTGFQIFERAAGGEQAVAAAFGSQYERYLVYLDCLFDELSLDLGVLFDRTDAMGLLFPSENGLRDLCAELNSPNVVHLWAEDETIGWIYQYYNDPEERKKMRKDSAAPRNSRELAVRNQFFTPRYVVEFLTDNTLGRIWYEMTRGQTRLAEECRYLVRRPTEIFLSENEIAPETPHQEDLGQEELLKQPFHIPHRPLKDPRELRLIDPACGSMHFGLYAFDLFEAIYEEAWDNDSCPALQSAYVSKDEFLKDVPRLIIEHNIHGIDIDHRAVQIAGLSLWLRAQKTWQARGVKPAERPRVRRSNIVCAEPMPGSPEILEEFVATLYPPLLGELVKTVFDKMQLAGEAGSLLKIEEEIRTAINEAKKLWSKSSDQLPGLDAATSSADLRPLSADFWETAESGLLDALRAYAEKADADSYQRRLFADDAVRGFAFIDLCRQRYDVALMNPPFGDASLPSKPYIEDTYGDTKGDVYKAFVECFHARLVPAGYLGIISSRTGFFLGQSEDWRTRVVLRLFRPIALADLGSGVLDAMVEVAAYVLRSLSAPEARNLTLSLVPGLGKVVRDSQDRFSLPKWQAARGGLKRHQAVAELEHLEAHGFVQRSSGDTVRYTPLWHLVKTVPALPEPVYPPLVCVRALGEKDKGAALADGVRAVSDQRVFVCAPKNFSAMPGSTFAYWVSNQVLRLFRNSPQFSSDGRTAKQGLATADDFRFVRSCWEVPYEQNSGWAPFSKGGSFSPYYSDIHLAVNWQAEGAEMKAWAETLPGTTHWSRRVASVDFYFRPGLTWPRRSQRGLALRVLPRGCVFSDKGPTAFIEGDSDEELFALLGIVNSNAFRGLVSLQMAFGSFEVGVIQRTAVPRWNDEERLRFAAVVREAWGAIRALDTAHSASHAFLLPSLLVAPGSTLAERAAAWTARVRTGEETVAAIQAEIDDLAFRLYRLDSADRAALTSTLATEAICKAEAADDEEQEEEPAAAPALASDLLAYALGCAFGRWDIRIATRECYAPSAPAPFAPLPVCPPGMLQNAAGLPAASGDVPASYPLPVTWPGILVDDLNHPEDIVTRLREVIEVIWKDRAEAIETEACQILEVKAKPKEGLDALRVYFRDPNRFFKDHLARYSKSRRKAPIYWPLSTDSGSYTLWIYYHRLNRQTLFTCIERIDLKREDLGRETETLRSRIGTGGTTDERQKVEDQANFLTELKTLRDRLLEVTALPYYPDLNDGVQITAAPLWQCFRHGPWQKVLKETWTDLAKKEKYDWAHLAMSIWPDRVVPKCAKDRSLAIAHGIDDLLWVPDFSSKKNDQLRPLKSPEEELKLLKQAGHSKEDLEKAAEDVTAAEKFGLRPHLWIEQPTGTWRRRKSPKEEIENEIARRKGR